MGVRRELLDPASGAAPSEIEVLSESELLHYRVKTAEIDTTQAWSLRKAKWTDRGLEAWSYRPSGVGEPTVFVSVRRALPDFFCREKPKCLNAPGVFVNVDVHVGVQLLNRWLDVMNRLPISLSVGGKVVDRNQTYYAGGWNYLWHRNYDLKGVAQTSFAIRSAETLEALASGSALELRVEGEMPAASQDVTLPDPSFELPLTGLSDLLPRVMDAY